MSKKKNKELLRSYSRAYATTYIFYSDFTYRCTHWLDNERNFKWRILDDRLEWRGNTKDWSYMDFGYATLETNNDTKEKLKIAILEQVMLENENDD